MVHVRTESHRYGHWTAFPLGYEDLLISATRIIIRVNNIYQIVNPASVSTLVKKKELHLATMMWS